MESNKIKCPNCGHQFPVEDALFSQAEERIRQEYEAKTAAQSESFKKQKAELEQQREELVKARENETELLDKKLQEKLAEEKTKLVQSTQLEFEDKLKALQEENEKKRTENKSLKEKEITLLKREAELIEKQEDLNLKMEKEMLERQKEIEEKARLKERESFQLEKIALIKQIDDNKKLAEEMKRKAEQGSMQLQGEVQELALEDLLRSEYPVDIIEEVLKGASGADVIQTVVNPLQQICGKIIYESKRTKAFSDAWIEKLKDDQRSQQAEIAIIVTETLPKDMEKFGKKDGVWICSFSEAKGLSFVLREMIIKTHSVRSSEENKGDKMSLLYNYLISEDFRHRVEAIVEGFSGLKGDLDKEKRAMQKIWKEREKQIEKVTANTIDMYASIKGIAGNAIGTVQALELTAPDEEEDV